MEPLNGTEDDDFLFAFEDGGEVFGLEGNDTLVAGEGEDILDAGAGDDVILGASDGDILIGGKGADTFVIDAESVGSIEIKDFELGVDKLDLSGFEHINPLDLHFEPFDYGEILILDDQEIVFSNLTCTLPGSYGPEEKTVDFEDYPENDPYGPYIVAGDYDGLDWSSFLRMDHTVQPSQYAHNIFPTSGKWVALFGPTDSLEVTHEAPFPLPFSVRSLSIGSATRDGTEAVFTAFRDGQVVGEKTVVVDTHHAKHVTFSHFNFGQIDRFEVSATDTGTPAADVPIPFGSFLYIDDLVWV